MENLESRFLSREQRALIKADAPLASTMAKILSPMIKKGNFILRSGRSTRYIFRFGY